MGVITYGNLELSVAQERLSAQHLKDNIAFSELKETLERTARDRPEGVLIEFRVDPSAPVLWVFSPQVWEEQPSGLGWRLVAVEGVGISRAFSFPGILQVDFLEAERFPNAWARVDFHEPPKEPERSKKGKKRTYRRFDFLDILVRRDAESRLFSISIWLRSDQEWMKIVATDRGHLDGVEASIRFSESWPRRFPPLVLLGNQSKMAPWLTIVVWPKSIWPEVRK